MQPCAATIALSADAALDVEIVSEASLSDGRAPSITIGPPTLSGVVYETTPQGRRPVAGALVEFDWIMDLVTATTRTDAEGRYVLCNLPFGRVDVWALKPDYALRNEAVDFRGDMALDIEIRRK